MFKTILKPLASLRLTVVLLAMSMFLVFAGTMAQVKMSNYDAQEKYFHSQLVWTKVSTLLDRPVSFFDVSIPFPGGYVIGAMLLINLLAAHSVRFKMSWKRSGIILTHLGLILLLVGEGLSSRLKVENNMNIDEGSFANFTYDLHEVELAVIDPSAADHDDVTVVPESILAKGGVITLGSLPFKLKVDAYYPNTTVMGEKRAGSGPKATVGAAAGIVAARGAPKNNGAGEEASAVDMPSIYVTPQTEGGAQGTYLCSIVPLAAEFPQINEPQALQVNGKSYTIGLRFKRAYKPYTIYLNKFRFDRYTGTDVAKNYSSDIRLVDPSAHEDRLIHIWMNHPLRYRGETFFQSGVGERGTILQVVSNPGWLLPYISCLVGGIGLLVHFGITLVNFLRRHTARASVPVGGLYTTGITPVAEPPGSGAKGRKNQIAPARGGIADWAVPGAVAFCFAVYLLSKAFSQPAKSAYDFTAFAQLPISHDGRIQPLDTTARVALRSLRGKEHITVDETDEKGEKTTREMPAAEWLADVIARPDKAADYKCFRIDWPDITGRLTTVSGEKYFSPNEVLAHWTEFAPQMEKASKARKEQKVNENQQKLLELSEKIQVYLHLGGNQTASTYKAFRIEDAELRRVLDFDPSHTILTLDELLDSQAFRALASEVRPMLQLPDEEMTGSQLKVVNLIKAIAMFQQLSPNESLRFVPPQKAGDDWHSLESVSQNARTAGAPRRRMWTPFSRSSNRTPRPSRISSTAISLDTRNDSMPKFPSKCPRPASKPPSTHSIRSRNASRYTSQLLSWSAARGSVGLDLFIAAPVCCCCWRWSSTRGAWLRAFISPVDRR